MVQNYVMNTLNFSDFMEIITFSKEPSMSSLILGNVSKMMHKTCRIFPVGIMVQHYMKSWNKLIQNIYNE